MGIVLERAQLPIAVATSNEGKIVRSNEAAQKIGLDSLSATTPLFDENAIKEEASDLKDNGIVYTVSISQIKLHRQRKATLEKEGREKDYMLVVSDSVLLDSSNKPLNRDEETPQRQQEVLEDINRNKCITFAGAVSFGRKNGYGDLTVVSYMSLPIAEKLTELPKSIDALQELYDTNQAIEVGYISFGGEEGNQHTKKSVALASSFGEARPYVSGLTPEVLEMIHKTGQFESKIGPILEDVISKNPFNTAGFYHALEKNGKTLDEFYSTFSENWKDHLNKYGGNCSLLSLEAGKRVIPEGINAEIVLYPQNGKPEGHSALLLTDPSGDQFFSDPGFSMPYVIPVNGNIPLAPARINGAKSMTVVENGTELPTVHVLEKSGKIESLVSNGKYSLNDFEQVLPEVLKRLHKREAIKLDYHTPAGKRRLGFTVFRKTRQVNVRNHDINFGSFDLDQFDYQTNPDLVDKVNSLALRYGLNPHEIVTQLDTLRRKM